MRLCYFDDFRLGVVKGANVVEVTSVVSDIPHTGPHNLMSGLIAQNWNRHWRKRQRPWTTINPRYPQPLPAVAVPRDWCFRICPMLHRHWRGFPLRAHRWMPAKFWILFNGWNGRRNRESICFRQQNAFPV